MTEYKELGKIGQFDVGIGGYQDAMLGVHITLSGQGWGVCTSECTWSPSLIKWTEHTKWTEDDRSKSFDKVMRFIDRTLFEAKVNKTQKLIGIPIEAIFNEERTLKSWRILTEVL